MHYLDIIILIVIIIAAIKGGFHGLVYGISTLLGIAAGFILALELFAELAAYLKFFSLPLWITKIISFLLIFIGVNIGFRLLGKALRGLLKKVFMGWLDRASGAAFGAAKGLFLVLLIIAILLLSPLGPIMHQVADETLIFAPLVELVKPFTETLLEKAPPNIYSI